ncbi:hypothetical protein ACHHYP_04623 [Achlya hypogyna]|uniref:Uncharacterized protein n=1 Tax=Achlya hypogyna TaxID=1202772 RepID=A0A1V9ZP06_ACHHY|nr:hypothetical protein ACHHYP_04623 [Achlya hypogyna]
MCTALFVLTSEKDSNGAQRVKLVVAHNRDEHFTRATARCEWWAAPNTTLFAPRDLQGGGTWFGIRKSSGVVRAAFLTNIRHLPVVHGKQSRGAVIKDFLASDCSTESYLKELTATGHHYPGFNVVVFDGTSLGHFCNFAHGEYVTESSILDPNVVYGMSNGPFASPWPKVVAGKEAMAAVLEQPGQDMELCRRLIPIMGNTTRIESAKLLPKTGFPEAMEFKLSSLFVEPVEPYPSYGTRTTLAMVLDTDGQCSIVEKDLEYPSGEWSTREYAL